MKNLILIIAVIVLSACATTTTMKSVAGTYLIDEVTKVELLDNGSWGLLDNKGEFETQGKWEISKEGEIHFHFLGDIAVLRINEDSSLTLIEERKKS